MLKDAVTLKSGSKVTQGQGNQWQQRHEVNGTDWGYRPTEISIIANLFPTYDICHNNTNRNDFQLLLFQYEKSITEIADDKECK